MPESSLCPRERARKNVATVLQAVQRDTKQVAIATAMGISEATVSRMLSEQLERFAALLAFAGLKVVSNEMKCYPEDYAKALHVMARMHVQNPPEQLTWD